jgi:hypothetical protein
MIGLKESSVRTADEFAHDGFKIAVDEHTMPIAPRT